MTEATKPQTNETAGELYDPVHRVSYSFRADGPNLCVFTWMDPGAHLPEHFHPSYEEVWEVLEGTARVKLNGDWRDVRPADGPVLVQRSVRHELANESEDQVRLRTEVNPAGRLEEFLRETARAAQEGLYNARNMPTSLRGALWAARLAQSFRDDTVMTFPPPALQRIVVPLVARFGRRGPSPLD
jgi:mannose-6-phosphate isomerase-like protein (cupin superfamily)